jgi:hypothetical protein
MSREKFPATVYVYVSDYLDDGTPVLSVSTHIPEIPENQAGKYVGVYILKDIGTFFVDRSIELQSK